MGGEKVRFVRWNSQLGRIEGRSAIVKKGDDVNELSKMIWRDEDTKQ